MTTFINEVLNKLVDRNLNLSNLTFILPSKRAGVFLKHQIANMVSQTILAPKIISIEEFVEDLSQLHKTSNTELLFNFYTVYLKCTRKELQEPFDSFSKWAQIVLQDFNEIDRYLIPQNKIFNYLSAIQDLKHWSLEENKTQFVINYLSFWKNLNQYYTAFTELLLEQKMGYQGLIYREAVENIEAYIQNNTDSKHIFLGFNALNTAEEIIIQELLQNDIAEIFWDIDSNFFDNQEHGAGLFTRQYKNNWKHFKKHSFNWLSNHYQTDKEISVYGVPKNVGQAKQIGSILEKIVKTNKNLSSTAVVLADENLLEPTLQSLPSSINALNITMGFPLKSIPLSSLFEQFFSIHKKPSSSFYYKDVIPIISHPYIQLLFNNKVSNTVSTITNTILKNNIVYISAARLKQIAPNSTEIIDLLFAEHRLVDKILASCLELIQKIKAVLDSNKSQNLLSLEYLFRFNTLFNELTRLNIHYQYLVDVSTLHSVYKELLSTSTLDFKGEPLQGLQIMGMLESRVLDFETLIIASVNEGVLPSGKTNNSFIPFDVKLENNLPTYKEKDAVYTYHFYRLLQRAKNIHVLYNTETDVLTGGEKSRFITQLELENKHQVKHYIVTPKVVNQEKEVLQIVKTKTVIAQINTLINHGLSPSSLSSYIRNPIEFYKQKILNIEALETVEENVAFNTLGTVVHNTLEDLYQAFIGEILTVEAIENLKSKIHQTVSFHFKTEYKEGDITKGKNLIIFEIAKRYVLNFLNLEINNIKQGNTIKIITLEENNQVIINIPGIDQNIKLTGKVDRVDQYNGMLRIIDYKTGRVQQNQVSVANWDELTTDYEKYSKSFQVLMYAYMMWQQNKISLPIEAGIISFKNLNEGFLKFRNKTENNNSSIITQETLQNFEKELHKLILEICNPLINFTEKEV